ncbi:MAG: NUDIX domain-containing protein [Patescibacteria group bacterium]|mgnify:FL=1
MVPKPTQPEKIVYQGLIVEVVQQNMNEGNGKIKTYEFARRSPGIRLIIIGSDKRILLSKEYRSEIKSWDFRLPGGKIFDSLQKFNSFLATGQNILVPALTAAKKEAEEEAGIRTEDIKHFATSTCGATMRWDLFYFVVAKFTALDEQSLGEGENIETNWFTFSQAREMCLSGQISEDRSAAVLLRYLHTQAVLK